MWNFNGPYRRRRFRICPTVDVQPGERMNETDTAYKPGQFRSNLTNPIVGSDNSVSDSVETAGDDEFGPTSNKKFWDRFKKFFQTGGHPLLKRVKSVFKYQKSPNVPTKERSIAKQEDNGIPCSYLSTSGIIDSLQSYESQKQARDTLWSTQFRTVTPDHPPATHMAGELRSCTGTVDIPEAPLPRLPPSRSTSSGASGLRNDVAIKEVGCKGSPLRGNRLTDLGKADILPAFNGKPDPFTKFLKEYSEGNLLTENPFEGNPNIAFLAAPLPPNEANRLAKLATYNLKKDDSENFKYIVELAQNIFKTKTVFVSVIGKNEEWFKARIGFEHSKIPRTIAICAHTILKQDHEPFVVPDTTKDWRFARNPSVVGDPFVRFYAGAPLRTADGYNLGTFCIMDPVPRDFSSNERQLMTEFAALATSEFELLQQKSGSRVCHINQMAVSQFAQQAPYCKNVDDIFDCVCLSISKTLKTHVNFVLEVTSLAEKTFSVRAAQGMGELSKRGREFAYESSGMISRISKPEVEFFEDVKELNTGSSHVRGWSFSENKTRVVGSEHLEPPRRTSFREMGRHGSIRTIRLLEDLVDYYSQILLLPATTDSPLHNKNDPLAKLTHHQFAELLFPQTRGFCCCTVPFEPALRTVSLFDFQKFRPVRGAEKLSPQDAEVMYAPSPSDSGTMYIIGAFSKDPTIPLTDCQLTCLLSFATALSSAVSHHKSEVALRKSEADVWKEKELLSALVNNILPPVYAERLKADQCAVADRFSNCSILFADIVGFTTIGGKMAADELVGMLNKIFIRFDMIAEDLCVEKIKTIGDCYMAATGVPIEQHDHAEIMAEFALALLAAVNNFNKTSDTPIQIRIGINSGPVVAGAIGHSKFVYDLWGHAVNIAQRMEAGSIAGRINVSQDTYSLLQKKYRFTQRGSYPVKGAGLMEMYFLEGRCHETRDEEGLLPEDALVRYVESAIADHTVFGRLNALQNLSRVGQCSSSAKSGSFGVASALVGSLCELSGKQ